MENINYNKSDEINALSSSETSYNIAKALQDEGYRTRGIRSSDETGSGYSGLGIFTLAYDPNSAVNSVLRKIGLNKSPRAYTLGTLWLNEEDKGAKHDESWVLESNGIDNTARLSAILSPLSEQSNVSLEVKLDISPGKIEKLPRTYASRN